MNSTSIINYQNEIKKAKGICLYDNEVIKYIQKPIGKSLYLCELESTNNSELKIERKVGRPKKKIKCETFDILICDVCGNKFTRSNRSSHKKTKVHIAYSKMNVKIRDLLLE